MGTSINVNFTNLFPQGDTRINMSGSNPSCERGNSAVGLTKPLSAETNKEAFKSIFGQSSSPNTQPAPKDRSGIDQWRGVPKRIKN